MATQTLVGKVLSINNVPVPGVRVCIFDRDIGNGDDDLTITPGQSNATGDFTVTYDPSRYQDAFTTTKAIWEPTAPPTWSNPLGTWGWVNHTVSLPDLTDLYLPYLQFSYSIGGQARVQVAPLVPFQTQFTLPEIIPSTPFKPSVHGFKFTNSFTGYPLPFTVPGLPALPPVLPSYGLCGGMSSAAADFFAAGKSIPAATAVPAQGSPLHSYIYQRQIDTFGGGVFIKKFADWMVLPDGTPLGTRRRTADEFAQIRAVLDSHGLVVLGLVYTSFPALLWTNHQVLAHSYVQTSSNTFKIGIYDPNFPGDDTIAINAQLVSVGSIITGIPPQINTVLGLQCTQITPAGSKPVRGFFGMPYQPVTPPPGL